MPRQGSLPVPPPRRAAKGAVPLDELWAQLAPARQQQALRILACAVARQILQPPAKKEANDER